MTRAEFSKSVRVDAFRRAKGRCENPKCGLYIKWKPHEFDHRIPCAFTDDNSLENCVVLCLECHTKKTKLDIKAIAKSNRIRAREAGIRRPRSILQGRKLDGTPVRYSRER